jgi:hypothetical protein
MTAACLIALTPPANALANVYTDAVGDSSPADTRGDIRTVGVNYSAAGNILVATQNVTMVSPYSDANWLNGDGFMSWDIDVNGDGVNEYWVGVIGTSSGPSGSVFAQGGTSPLCSASAGFDATIGVTAFFSGSCIGSPASFRIRGGSLYGTANTFDSTPYCCNVIPSDSTPTTTTTQPPPTTTTTTQPDPGLSTAGVHDGYWMATSAGEVYTFGNAGYFGAGGPGIVHVEPSVTGRGYWLLGKNGAVYGKGDAPYFGPANLTVGESAVSLSSTPSGKGYWIFTDKGRVTAYGDAASFGDMANQKLNGPILGSVSTPTGKGYWMVASDGGIFSFGDAAFHGSTGNLKLNKPVMAMAPAANGSGYWLVASDGGIFAFDVPFYGSMGGTPLNKPISGMVPGAGGYMMVSQDGGIFSFGSVSFHGSLGAAPPSSPVVSIALLS